VGTLRNGGRRGVSFFSIKERLEEIGKGKVKASRGLRVFKKTQALSSVGSCSGKKGQTPPIRKMTSARRGRYLFNFLCLHLPFAAVQEKAQRVYDPAYK
jgi:hypothetical protein